MTTGLRSAATIKNNPIAADRLRYDILFHSDLSREYGISNGLDLSHQLG